MYKKYITLISLVFLALSVSVAEADKAPTAAKPASEQAAPVASLPASMTDEALASYITGRLKQALVNDDYKVEQLCDDTGCSVVVH